MVEQNIVIFRFGDSAISDWTLPSSICSKRCLEWLCESWWICSNLPKYILCASKKLLFVSVFADSSSTWWVILASLYTCSHWDVCTGFSGLQNFSAHLYVALKNLKRCFFRQSLYNQPVRNMRSHGNLLHNVAKYSCNSIKMER